MTYSLRYKTPVGFDDIVLYSDGEYLTGLIFDNDKTDFNYKKLDVFDETIKWLDIYFSGNNPNFTPKYKIKLTDFEQQVTDIMNKIPFGKTITYGQIAEIIAKKKGIEKMSSQAVGNAVGKNPICIIIPCHRVMGKNNNLTGYGGGLKNKIGLLQIEGNDISKYKMLKKGNKL